MKLKTENNNHFKPNEMLKAAPRA